MQNSDDNNILFTTESDALLKKCQNRVFFLNESIKNHERKNFEIQKNLNNQKSNQNDLNCRTEKLILELSEKMEYLKKIKNFQSFFGLLILILKLVGAKIQSGFHWIILKFYFFSFERNRKTIQKNNEEIVHLNDKISNIFSQRQKGFEIYKGEWLYRDQILARKEAEIGLSDNFNSMSDRDFEFFIAELFNEMGYETQVTPKSADYGVDIIAKKGREKIAIQCKKFNEKNFVPNKSIQQLLGSMAYYNANHSIFVTTSYYTKNSLKQTKNGQIELWDKDTLHGHVKKYLLKKDASKIFSAIENAQMKENEKKARAKLELEEKKERQRDKTICHECGGRKLKNRKICSRCKNARKRRYDDYYGGGSDFGNFPEKDWDSFGRNFGRW